MKHWAYDSIFYHIYPLGLCGAPARNDFTAPSIPRLDQLYGWIDHLRELGVNAVYLGPVFESSAHGYDTADYFRVDRRLGENVTLKQLIEAFHQNGLRVILDGVFNHVGRDFWAFRDVQERREQSAYCGWFQGLTFDRSSPYQDPFAYDGWNGHYSLVKLNLHHSAVKAHLFQAVEMWLREFKIDGLRLDVADCLDLGFQKELAAVCRSIRADCWLMGEVVHGDYRRWANAETLDSVTNYECYKGLYSSHVDKNYFEIAYALNRQFGTEGLYRGLPLYNFADNHDVNRVASNLTNPKHLYPLYCLLFTMPGVPSIYYGSEWGLEGSRTDGSDVALRPSLDLAAMPRTPAQRDLARALTRLAQLRKQLPALRHGDYQPIFVSHEQLAFARQTSDECVVIAINAAEQPVSFEIAVPWTNAQHLVDVLNDHNSIPVTNGRARIDHLWAHWARVMRVER